MHHTLRRTYYWPSMSMDAYQTVRECVSCQLNRIKERRHTNFCKLFPAVSPLEFICIDILGPLPKTRKGNRYLLVMCDRFSKLTKTQPLKRISTEAVAEAFCTHWVYNFGPPAYVLTENGTQFESKFFAEVCQILGIRKLFTTSYHPRTNGQA